MSVAWNTGSAAERFRHNLKLKLKNKNKKKKQASNKRALTMDPGACRMNIERRIMEVEQLKRIADAIEEILRIVKKDMEPKKK